MDVYIPPNSHPIKLTRKYFGLKNGWMRNRAKQWLNYGI